MVNFLLLIENNINYTKKIIDSGQTPQIIYELCSCIRETFCLSYSIRKTNFLYIYFQKEHVFVKFEGKKLRYLGPDERSQALLLEKALNKVKEEIIINNSIWIKSTPGIFIRKFYDVSSFIKFYRSIALEKSFLIINTPQIDEDNVDFYNLDENLVEIKENDFFIIPIYVISRENSKLIELFKEVKNIKLLSLSKIKKVENKILYINFRKDQQRTL
ncbi:MAG: hypothetical protein KAT57_13795 [Candidatus Lokiarchaeota archaeon]|nr:hypothetical protein [Candidatus Lokiarchaeota archaeon]